MKLLTEAEQVCTAAQRWREQHEQPGGCWVTLQDGRSSRDVYENLIGLRADTAADVEAIVGNNRLVHPHACAECGLMFWRCVEFPGGTVLCTQCLCRGLSAALGVGGV